MSNLCWIRRDLRLHDHLALSKALEEGETTVVFIFDTQILDKLTNKQDSRLTFIYQSLTEMEKELQKHGSSLLISYGDPTEEIPKIAKDLNLTKVFTNRDYEPYAKKRDHKVQELLKKQGVEFHSFKDSVFFEKEEITTNDGNIYKVFTPYKNKWLEAFENMGHTISDYTCNLKNLRSFKNPKNILTYNWYQDIGFKEKLPFFEGGTTKAFERLNTFAKVIDNYDEARNFPSMEGTSNLSPYIRHGCLSIRDMLRLGVSHSSAGAKTWVSELIWRDFYQMILDSYPTVEKGPFKPDYAKIHWEGEEEDFKAWCEGKTGYPIVDAAMRCFNATGTMHNRLRMIVASFLCKTLLVNWQKGEKYFADHLLDFDLAANNGGWQWSSSSGTDAQPYFRIFNPYSQSQKFDPEGSFIRQWVPEIAHLPAKEIHDPSPLLAPNYPRPIVDYKVNRAKALEMYSVVKKS